MFRKKGFTLLELIIVIIVIGILASIALPRYLAVAERARMTEGKNILGILRGAQLRYEAEHQTFAGNFSDLDIGITASKYFDDPIDDDNVESGTINTTIAIVTRNTIDAGTYNYNISITGEGVFDCEGTFPAGCE
ncbi:MAG: prepilin-type N-terminal cleavage/methylation domain-containing protein [Candidatus Omnitrophica bacterium]|nr:prepilin-type N-terminal cleavage/methylation domain-containing protein [Candidatus Omnitrophota bacterium]